MTPRARSPFLDVAGVADLLGWSRRSVHERTRRRAMPMRRIAGSQRCLFIEREVLAWVDGAELEVRETPDGGVVVRPLDQGGGR